MCLHLLSLPTHLPLPLLRALSRTATLKSTEHLTCAASILASPPCSAMRTATSASGSSLPINRCGSEALFHTAHHKHTRNHMGLTVSAQELNRCLVQLCHLPATRERIYNVWPSYRKCLNAVHPLARPSGNASHARISSPFEQLASSLPTPPHCICLFWTSPIVSSQSTALDG